MPKLLFCIMGIILLKLLPHFPSACELTHWGRVTTNHHWFKSWLVTWSAPSHYLNQCANIGNWNLRNNLQWNFNQNSCIFIQENRLEMSSGKWRPFCLHLNVLTHCNLHQAIHMGQVAELGNFGCLVTWFCYQLIAKSGNKTAAVSWPDPYALVDQLASSVSNHQQVFSIPTMVTVIYPSCQLSGLVCFVLWLVS